MDKRIQLFKYLLADFLAAVIVWTLFSMFRLVAIDNILPENVLFVMPRCNFRILIFIVPFFWLFLHYISGYYNQVLRKSRLSELITTLGITFFGSLALFFLLLIDDPVESYTHYYISFLGLFILQFLFTYIPRLCITQSLVRKIHNRTWGFNTLIIGTGKEANSVAQKIDSIKPALGNKIIGFVTVSDEIVKVEPNKIVGEISALDKLIIDYQIKEIIVATDDEDTELTFNVLGKAHKYNVEVKIIPKLHDILIGHIRMNTIYSLPLINISQNEMPYWQQNIKRVFDIVVSLLVLIVLSPLFLYISIRVKMSSSGPVFYMQERIGKRGRPFKIIKFRTMFTDAEKNVPMLSSPTDKRITKFGRTLRKFRMDELPQFINVLTGDMSLVGYRPERQYFIDQIVQRAPHYYLLQRIQPGITSWGIVKYGYADSVDKMIDRLEYDIIYLENISLMIDLKILIYTFKIIFSGRGV